MTTPAPDILQGLNVDPVSAQQLASAAHLGLARNGAKAETISRAGSGLAAITLASASVIHTAINLQAGTVVTNIVIVTNTTAGSGVTHALAGIYSSAKARLASSADLVAAQQFAASSEIVIPLSAPYTVTADGIYYLALGIVSGTTVPTLTGLSGVVPTLNALAPQPGFTDASGITTTLPATATVTAGSAQLYAYVS